MVQTIVCVIIFGVMVPLAVVLSTYVKVQNNLHSYVMMRAIGANQRTLYRLVTQETLRLLVIGGIIGTLIGIGITGYLAISYSYVKSWDIYLYYVAPAILLVFSLLCLLSIAVIRKPIKSLLDKSIVEELNAVEQ